MIHKDEDMFSHYRCNNCDKHFYLTFGQFDKLMNISEEIKKILNLKTYYTTWYMLEISTKCCEHPSIQIVKQSY